MKKNFGISADKIPNGYVKLEIKNAKCKICFYVQNLKPIAEDYKMLLLSGDKTDGKIIDLGKAKIDNNGKCEINIEKSMDSLASIGISMDKIIGAAIGTVDSNKLDGVMCGFSIKDVPKDWTEYKIVKDHNEDNIKEKEYKKVEEYKEYKPVKKVEKIEELEECKPEEKLEKIEKLEEYTPVEKLKECKSEEKTNFYNKDKEVYCDDRKHEKQQEESYYTDDMTNPQNNMQALNKGQSASTNDIINPQNSLQELEEEETQEEKAGIGSETNQAMGTGSNKGSSNTMNSNMNNMGNMSNVDNNMNYMDNMNSSMNNMGNNMNNNMKSNAIDFDGYEQNIKGNLKESFFRGASGEFFEYLVSGLEEVKDVMPEIKKCKWYKIRVKTLDDLYYITDYRKYSMIYYPMVNNYPYICKYGHYLFGYKLDENNNLKYMLYAVPGTKHPYDQPYGGKTGYVMWLPMEKGKEGEKDPGYWVMFYDFKDATVCVPAKKE